MVDISRSVIVEGILPCFSFRFPWVDALLDTVADLRCSVGRSHPAYDNSFAIIVSLRQVHLQFTQIQSARHFLNLTYSQ